MAASGIENLPEQVNSIEYLVSRELLRVAIKMYVRTDFVAPGEQMRDLDTGKVVCCRRFLKHFE